jgi:cell fate (sporulation/competence/biofilm development) regulator YlbF (YheA/YmcA/DUF963 family)
MLEHEYCRGLHEKAKKLINELEDIQVDISEAEDKGDESLAKSLREKEEKIESELHGVLEQLYREYLLGRCMIDVRDIIEYEEGE